MKMKLHGVHTPNRKETAELAALRHELNELRRKVEGDAACEAPDETENKE